MASIVFCSPPISQAIWSVQPIILPTSVMASCTLLAAKDDFVDMFRIVKGGIEELSDDLKNKGGWYSYILGLDGALMKTEDISGFPNLTVDPATIDEIVVFTSKKGDDYE